MNRYFNNLLLIIAGYFLSNGILLANIPDNASFIHISIDEGLSQSTVFSIVQDDKNSMWFATYDGLNKYNGYRFTVYRHDPQVQNSIASDIIRTLFVDSENRLWIGTRSGLSLYDSTKEAFVNYPKDNSTKVYRIQAISEFDKNLLLLATSEELVLFDVEKEELIPVPGLENNNFVANDFLHSNGFIWIALKDGLILYDKESKKVIRSFPELKNIIVQSVLQETNDKIWVATEGEGLFLIDETRNTIKQYRHSKTDDRSISSDYIRSLGLDNKGRLWVGTFEGLNIYDRQFDNFVRYTNDPVDNTSISQNSIRSIYKDNQGGMWCGTYFGGLNYYHSLNNRFKHIKFIPNKNSLNDKVISCITEDKDHNLWIGTNDKGVNFYNSKTKRFSYYMNSLNYDLGINSNNVKTIYVDDKNDLVYIGTHAGGLNILNRKNDRIEHLNTHNSPIVDNNVYSVIGCDDESLWIGTLKGVMKYNTKSKFFTTENEVLNNISVSYLFKDSKSRLWIGTENGIIVYLPDEKRSITIDPIFNNLMLRTAFINCIVENQKGEICIGTRSGFYIYNEVKKELEAFYSSNGLASNVIYGILEDSLHRLWLSTNSGLVCYTPYSKEFRVYNAAHGLQSNQFNSYSFYKTHSGLMLFGGINGITSFYPEQLVDNPYTPAPIIDKLLLSNKVVMPDDETHILTQSISQIKEIELKAHQTSFSFELVVSNYISGQNNTFAYKLEGIDKDWAYLNKSNRTETYTNLDAGTYILKVRAANNDNAWSKQTTQLKITILPVWWKTWWATLLFFIVIVAIIVIVTRTIWFRKLLKKELKKEQIDKKWQEELNQMKTRFFISLSHELRTPLTLIESPLQEMLNRNKEDKWMQSQLQYIKKNTSKLMHIINQLMDYRRTELGVFELKVIESNLNDFVYENFLLYEGFAKKRKIDFSFDSEIIDQKVIFSPQYVESILSNLLSNAFKFTPDGGAVNVKLSRINEYILLEVNDTGKGIPKDLQEKIFDRFYQVSPNHTGSGIGLSLVKNLVDMHHGYVELESEENKGSCFKIYISQERNAYSESDFIFEAEVERTVHWEILENMPHMEDVYNEEDEAMAQKEKKGILLIVEDNVEIADYLVNELCNNYNILRANDGLPAMEILKEQEVDLVITDVMLPEMDGIKLCKSIKQNIRTCHIPVIMISAWANTEDQIRGLQVGADDYITKPFSISVLQTKVYNILRSRKIIKDLYSNSNDVSPEKITFNVLDEELINKATEIVRKNMDNIDFSTEDLSREMAMSRSNLHLKLKAITGASSIEFIRKIRFNEACRLLREGRYNVSEVSAMVGFNSPSYFATSFKKYVGVLPTEYVKKPGK